MVALEVQLQPAAEQDVKGASLTKLQHSLCCMVAAGLQEADGRLQGAPYHRDLQTVKAGSLRSTARNMQQLQQKVSRSCQTYFYVVSEE